jgi:hypothetical protein
MTCTLFTGKRPPIRIAPHATRSMEFTDAHIGKLPLLIGSHARAPSMLRA